LFVRRNGQQIEFFNLFERPETSQPITTSNKIDLWEKRLLLPGSYEFDALGVESFVTGGSLGPLGVEQTLGTTDNAGMSLESTAVLEARFFDARDLVGNSVEINLFPNTIEMAAKFAPTFPDGSAVSLNVLTTALDIDHFNWVQTVSGPGNMQIRIVDANGQIVDSDPSPLYDPVVEVVGNERYQIKVDGNALGDVRTMNVNIPPGQDDAIPFWATSPVRNHFAKDFIVNDHEFFFSDSPAVPDWALDGPNFFMSFETELVGVKDNGTVVRFRDQPKTRFRWKSNARFIDDLDNTIGGVNRAAFFASPFAESFDIELIGGVYDADFLDIEGPETMTLLGDIDNSGEVDFADFLILSANFGQMGESLQGDIDSNGQVAFADFLILSANFGEVQAINAVPEPSQIGLLVSVVTLSVARRRRSRMKQ